MSEDMEARAKADETLLADLAQRETAQLERVDFKIPGPFSYGERLLCYYIASELYTGKGSFVELGSFLGASTQAFAVGLTHNHIAPDISRVIDTYDLYRMMSNWNTSYQNNMLSEADKLDFLPRLKENLSGYELCYRAHRADILNVMGPYDKERDIEVLFVDLCKTEEIMLHVASQFFSRMFEGGYYMQQDYLFPGLPFIKSFHEYFWEYFEVIHIVDSSILFRIAKKFDVDDATLRYYRDLPRNQKKELVITNGRRFASTYRDLFQESAGKDHPGWYR